MTSKINLEDPHGKTQADTIARTLLPTWLGFFVKKNKKIARNKKITKQYNYGFQDYSFPPYTHDNPMPNKWSGCSNDDFMAAYQLFKSRDGTYCLEERVPPIGIIIFQVQLRSG